MQWTGSPHGPHHRVVTRRALTFGSAAAAYERYRPAYPDQVAAEVFDYARQPVRTALEIGAGTGKATRLFAAHGVAVTATEPDAAMIDELRKHVPPSVEAVQASFEDLTPAHTYDLVYAAAALHWTEPERRWARIAAMLTTSGIFANFGGPARLADQEVEAAVRAARAPWLAEDDLPPPDGTPMDAPTQWPGTELERSGLFTDVRQVVIERRLMLSAPDYVGHLSTVSAYLALPDAQRRRALDRILDVLPSQVEVLADIHLHLARRV